MDKISTGTRVIVRKGGAPWEGDRAFKNCVGTIQEFTSTGYARLHLNGAPEAASVLIHPENLQPLTPRAEG